MGTEHHAHEMPHTAEHVHTGTPTIWGAAKSERAVIEKKVEDARPRVR